MTANMDTAREYSAMIGNETITNISRIGQKLSLDKSLTESYEEHPLSILTSLCTFTGEKTSYTGF